MTAFAITGAITAVAQDTAATITLSEDTVSFTGNKSTSVLKIDNPDLTTNLAITFSLTGAVSAYDANNSVLVPANSTVFVQVAPAGFTGSVYVYNSAGGADGAYIQPVVIIG